MSHCPTSNYSTFKIILSHPIIKLIDAPVQPIVDFITLKCLREVHSKYYMCISVCFILNYRLKGWVDVVKWFVNDQTETDELTISEI